MYLLIYCVYVVIKKKSLTWFTLENIKLLKMKATLPWQVSLHQKWYISIYQEGQMRLLD